MEFWTERKTVANKLAKVYFHRYAADMWIGLRYGVIMKGIINGRNGTCGGVCYCGGMVGFPDGDTASGIHGPDLSRKWTT